MINHGLTRDLEQQINLAWQEINQDILMYLNRLSDLLFVLARVTNNRQNYDDIPWKLK